MNVSNQPSVWIAAAVSIAVVAWGLTQTRDLIRHGDIPPIHAALTLNALVLGTAGFWLERWWGLVLAACGVIYLLLFSTLSGLPATFAAMALFYLPMVVVAGLNRSKFKW